MTKEECYALIKKHSNETIFLSYHPTDIASYKELLAGGNEIIPFVLERLKDSIGHDRGNAMNWDNCSWLAISLLTEFTNGACLDGFPHEYSGQLVRLREYVINKMST